MREEILEVDLVWVKVSQSEAFGSRDGYNIPEVIPEGVTAPSKFKFYRVCRKSCDVKHDACTYA